MSLEVFKVIALLCQNFAGDTPSMGFTVNQVQVAQAHCHKFYVNCYLVEKKDMEKCILKRAELFDFKPAAGSK